MAVCTFFKLYKQYQIVQRITYSLMLTELLIYVIFFKNTELQYIYVRVLAN